MLDEFAFHFGRIQDQLHDLCKFISSNDMQIDPNINGGNNACENGFFFYDNDDFKYCFNEKFSISQDNILGTND